jgi:hypothetical protein
MQRLDKILSDASVASRRELKQIIHDGRVAVDGVTRAATRRPNTTRQSAEVRLDGAPIHKLRPALIMLNKPAGYLTAVTDERAKTVMELIPRRIPGARRQAGGPARQGDGGAAAADERRHVLAPALQPAPRHLEDLLRRAHGRGDRARTCRRFWRASPFCRAADKCLPARTHPAGTGQKPRAGAGGQVSRGAAHDGRARHEGRLSAPDRGGRPGAGRPAAGPGARARTSPKRSGLL